MLVVERSGVVLGHTRTGAGCSMDRSCRRATEGLNEAN
jgi:hypothetical protein